ncbi:MAG: kelch repeat-containing protein [bacterium]|nr:kelch repeat-containing protein [bacterium]
MVFLGSALIPFILPAPVSASTTNPACTQQIVLPGTTTPGWQQMPSTEPAFHIEGSNADVGSRVFLFTGFDSNALTAGNRVDVYNAATDVWETVAAPRNPMPFGGSHIQAVVYGSDVWMAGGYYGSHPSTAPSSQTWRYDTVNDLWETRPQWNMPEPRAANALVLNGRRIHLIGGISDTQQPRNTAEDDHWILDLDNLDAGWRAAAPLPSARLHLNGVAIDGIVYALGGQFRHDTNPQDVTLAHAYNPATDSWRAIAPLPFPRSHFEPGTMVINDRIVIVGGRDNTSGQPALTNVTEYNPQTDTWRELTPLPVALIGATARVLYPYIVVTAGGTDYNQGQANTWMGQIITDCVVVNQPPPSYAINPGQNAGAQPQPVSTGLSIAKSGALASGAAGQAGDRIAWTITVANDGAAASNITITDEVDPALRIDSVEISQGNSTVTGQTVSVVLPSLGTGQRFTIVVNTTIQNGSVTGLIANTARLNNGRTATTDVRVLPGVSRLPATGQTPQTRTVIVALVLGGLAGGLFGAFLFFPAAKKR